MTLLNSPVSTTIYSIQVIRFATLSVSFEFPLLCAGLDNPTLYRTFTAAGGLEVRQYFDNGKTLIYHLLSVSRSRY